MVTLFLASLSQPRWPSSSPRPSRALALLLRRIQKQQQQQQDAISMGLGDALSEKAEMDYVRREWARETWEMDENPAGEVRAPQ